jgi:hypothetical protein
MVRNIVVYVSGLWSLLVNHPVYMKNGKYFIVLFCNKKRIKVLFKCRKRTTVTEHWNEYKTQHKPPFLKLQGGKRKQELVFELALIYPNNRWSTKTYVKDSLGRNIEAKMDDDTLRIKEIIPYWKEEMIYDFQEKKRRYFDEIMKPIYKISEIAQIFTLNNKLFVQVEDDIRMYGNKNINDAERLFDVMRDDLLSRNRKNFIFVRDISTQQRKTLYQLLESKGFKRSVLFRHYSY